MSKQNNQPRPHAELIKAWADGTTIQFFDVRYNKWFDCAHSAPSWHATTLYRIKPEEQKNAPKRNDGYFYVDDGGVVRCTVWSESNQDFLRLDVGNVYYTQSVANGAAERVRAALKGEKSEEVKQDQWKPVLGETYFYIGEHALVYNDVWEGCDSEERYWKSGNIFKTEKEAEAAAERFMFVFCDEEPEVLKKLREENEELKKEIANAEARKSVLHPYLNGEPVSDGELALIRAIRKAGVSRVWKHGSAILVDKEDFVSRRDFIALLSSGVEADDDEVRAALNKISREQEEEQEEEDDE